MCGISAYFNLVKRINGTRDDRTKDQRHAIRTSQLDRSVELMRHRGPNAKGIWVADDNSAGLGHVRLSTRDLSTAGDQPMHSCTDSEDIHAVVNGELYYDQSLRDSLAEDYDFQSTSDSEMAIALYRRYGARFLQHLRGEFAIVIYDAKTSTLIAARDRFGVKPLHYGIFDGRLLIATQCKGLIELIDDKSAVGWDARCLAQGGGHYGGRTLFEGMRKFPIGHVLVVQDDHSGDLEFEPYYQTQFPANADGKDDRQELRLIEELRGHLLEAVRIRLESSDVPVGILLSGGVDSSAVAGMAAALDAERRTGNCANHSQPPTCFTIGFPDDDDVDESAVAERTARYLGLPFKKLVVTEQMLVDDFDEACWLGEALMWDLQHIAKKTLSRFISQSGLKVVLNGDGADELFAGYPFFVADRLAEDDKYRAPTLQKVDCELREKQRQDHASKTGWFGLNGSEVAQTDEASKALGLPPAFSKMAISRHDAWLKDEVRDLDTAFQAIHGEFSETEIEAVSTTHPLHRSLLAWRKTVLPNMVIAAISDGAEMAHGVESRPPFLDHIVADFASTLPVDMLVHLDKDRAPVEKWIFREAVKPFVTDEIYGKRKQAFAAPFKWKKDGALYQKLSSLITQENVENLGFADWSRCEKLVNDAFDLKDQLVFRRTIWLAQVISMGQQFQMPTWRSDNATAKSA